MVYEKAFFIICSMLSSATLTASKKQNIGIASIQYLGQLNLSANQSNPKNAAKEKNAKAIKLISKAHEKYWENFDLSSAL